ncbi:MAG: hypothetical protein ACI8X5_000574 [Planctomycetota bacterium]|jgi:hypothetical protein
MRTLILVLLGGVALYFAWPYFGGVDAALDQDTIESEEPVAPSAFGLLQSLAQSDAEIGEAEPPKLDFPDTENELQGVSRPVVDSEPQPASDLFDGLNLNALGDPLFEGSLLVHNPDGLEAYLSGPGEDLSKARKKLLIAYFLLADGQYGQVANYADGLDQAPDVTRDEYALLKAAMDGGSVRVLDASHRRHKNPLVLGASMAYIEREATEAATAGEWQRAATLLSEIMLAELDAPWEADDAALTRWSEGLDDAQSGHRWSPEGKWRSLEVVVEPGDTLVAIRKRVISTRPNLNICTGLIERSNKLGRYLREDQVLRIPLDQVHIVIDLSARWLFYLHGAEVVAAWPVAIGRVGQETTPGRYTVGNKIPEPTWFPEGRTPVPYGVSENPLGTRWIDLDGSNGLGIHGTWTPETLGEMASDGCIRLENRRVEQLFEIMPQGAEVLIRP